MDQKYLFVELQKLGIARNQTFHLQDILTCLTNL
nr:MAG TPA: hypothetical protein [Caudoviricetes sp.]